MSDPKDEIRRAVESAPVVSDRRDEAPGEARSGFSAEEADEVGEAPDDIAPPEPGNPEGVDLEIVKRCALLDQSDTDNGLRLRLHFGADLAVVASANMPGGDWAHWTGKHWDMPNGHAFAIQTAQRIGPRIALEIPHLAPSKAEAAAIADAEKLPADDETETAKAVRRAAERALKRASDRRAQRWRFSVTSKNSARISSMLAMAVVHLRRDAKDFNPDPRRFACETHTIRLVVEDDLDCPDPDVTRKIGAVEAREGFLREDWLTGLVPAPYDPQAKAPKFDAFLAECMPDATLRDTLQQYSGMGLIGVLAQRLMLHTGLGANGKSVFLAVLRGVLGPSFAVTLPKETIMGQGERGAGQASPDIIRLYAKRMVVVDELKENEPLREDVVKRLTGGDPIAARAMYEGYIEFVNCATPHMLSNGLPSIAGGDNGIWRRVIIMPWEVTIAEERQREFSEFVADLLTERSGILNWLIEGARKVLAEGLYVSPKARNAAAEYREDQDQVGSFIKNCVVAVPGEKVQARQMYLAYCAWAKANAKRPRSETRFGLDAKKHLAREGAAVKFYMGCRLTGEATNLLTNAPPLQDHPEEER